MPAVARVEPLIAARALRGPFDYLAADGVEVGSMVVVPFGRRELVGVVVGLTDEAAVPHERLLATRRTLALGVSPELVDLAAWVARQYCSTTARALALVLPPGGASERRLLVADLTVAGAAALDDDSIRLGERQRRVLAALRARGAASAASLGAGHDSLRRLAARGLIELDRRAVGRRPQHMPVGVRRAEPPPLNDDQRVALAALERAIAGGAHARHLLHGVTGSGKTEIYLRAAAAALARDRGVIVLVPEINLTPQTVTRFAERFGDTVAVLHSRLSAGERHDEWLRLQRGEARICVGPRSAVFAPIERLGLIVIDEEHDSSYKHEGDPRYDARAVALRRAELAGAVLVAGSATPRPESVHSLEALRLPVRADGSAMPDVELVDMRETRSALHPMTAEALAGMDGKAIILLNRRGWSNFVSCRSCGQVWGCPDCDVALVLHRGEGIIACHHCGHREHLPERCNRCESVSVARHGLGTERLEHELQHALDGVAVFRLDADVAERRGHAEEVLRRFERASSAVLIGTQMVAKGHDFADISLGVVLDADATLRFPDFRAEERTFALVAQLAGRTGRGAAARRGRVLVQSLAPDAASLSFAARHDADGFVDAELGRRRALRYPPFSTLIRVVCAGPEPGAAPAAAARLRELLDPPEATLLGPAPLFRLRGRERAQIVIKALAREPAIAAVGRAVAELAAGREHAGVQLSVDVDPQ